MSEDFIGHRQRLAAHIGHGRHTLIGYCADDTGDRAAASFDAAADAWRGALGAASNAVLIAAPGTAWNASEAYRVLTDSAGEFAGAFGAQSGMMWAVRPDGHIGFRSGDCSAVALMAWLDSALGGARRA